MNTDHPISQEVPAKLEEVEVAVKAESTEDDEKKRESFAKRRTMFFGIVGLVVLFAGVGIGIYLWKSGTISDWFWALMDSSEPYVRSALVDQLPLVNDALQGALPGKVGLEVGIAETINMDCVTVLSIKCCLKALYSAQLTEISNIDNLVLTEVTHLDIERGSGDTMFSLTLNASARVEGVSARGDASAQLVLTATETTATETTSTAAPAPDSAWDSVSDALSPISDAADAAKEASATMGKTSCSKDAEEKNSDGIVTIKANATATCMMTATATLNRENKCLEISITGTELVFVTFKAYEPVITLNAAAGFQTDAFVPKILRQFSSIEPALAQVLGPVISNVLNDVITDVIPCVALPPFLF